MFYVENVLRRRGPLAKVWIAATLGTERIPRSFLLHVDVARICTELQNAIQVRVFSLRLQAFLLFGLARIYERQVVLVCAAAEEWYGRVRLHAPTRARPVRGRPRNADVVSSRDLGSNRVAGIDSRDRSHPFQSSDAAGGQRHLLLADARARQRHTHGGVTWGLDPRSTTSSGSSCALATLSGLAGNADALWLLYLTETHVQDEENVISSWLRHALPLRTESPGILEPDRWMARVQTAASISQPRGTPYRVQNEDAITLPSPIPSSSAIGRSPMPIFDGQESHTPSEDTDHPSSMVPRRLLEELDAAGASCPPGGDIHATDGAPLPSDIDQTTPLSTTSSSKTTIVIPRPAHNCQERSTLGRERGRFREHLIPPPFLLDDGDALTIPPHRLRATMRSTRDLTHPRSRGRRTTAAGQGPQLDTRAFQSGFESCSQRQLHIVVRSLDADTSAWETALTKTLIYQGLVHGLYAVAVARSCPVRAAYSALVQHRFDADIGSQTQAQGLVQDIAGGPWSRAHEPNTDTGADLRAGHLATPESAASVPEQVRAASAHGSFQVLHPDSQLPGAYSSAIRSVSSEGSGPIPRVAVPALLRSGSFTAEPSRSTGLRIPASPSNTDTPVQAPHFTEHPSCDAGYGKRGAQSPVGVPRPVLSPDRCRETIIRLATQARASDPAGSTSSSWIPFDKVLEVLTTTATAPSVTMLEAQPPGPQARGRHECRRACAATLFAASLKLATTGEVSVRQAEPYATLELRWNQSSSACAA
ncbi:hypothetical protein CCYA_CCYA13G3456 [Cyanidiococcus yangmingshanensis]|nr:hypothetical protein CCYA_CCYA13G3456 [Cyanidiococcus yangmingshanensis]